MTTWPNTHLCCKWSYYGTHTIFCVLLCLHFVVLWCGFSGLSWVAPPWHGPLLCGLGAHFPCFGFADPKSRFFCLNFCSIFTAYQYAMPSEEVSWKSISSWMYLCRQPRYLSTKFRPVSLIPSFVRRVWKVFVNSDTSWSLPCCSVVHFMYLS